MPDTQSSPAAGGLRTYTNDELNDELKMVNISPVGLTRFQKCRILKEIAIQKCRILEEIAERAQRAQRAQRA